MGQRIVRFCHARAGALAHLVEALAGRTVLGGHVQLHFDCSGSRSQSRAHVWQISSSGHGASESTASMKRPRFELYENCGHRARYWSPPLSACRPQPLSSLSVCLPLYLSVCLSACLCLSHLLSPCHPLPPSLSPSSSLSLSQPLPPPQVHVPPLRRTASAHERHFAEPKGCPAKPLPLTALQTWVLTSAAPLLPLCCSSAAPLLPLCCS